MEEAEQEFKELHELANPIWSAPPRCCCCSSSCCRCCCCCSLDSILELCVPLGFRYDLETLREKALEVCTVKAQQIATQRHHKQAQELMSSAAAKEMEVRRAPGGPQEGRGALEVTPSWGGSSGGCCHDEVAGCSGLSGRLLWSEIQTCLVSLALSSALSSG